MFSLMGGWMMQTNLRTMRKSGPCMKSKESRKNRAEIQNQEIQRGKLSRVSPFPRGHLMRAGRPLRGWEASRALSDFRGGGQNWSLC